MGQMVNPGRSAYVGSANCTAPTGGRTNLSHNGYDEHRYAFISGLRELADYLGGHPDVPVPDYSTTIHVIAAPMEEGGARWVDEVADLLGVPVEDRTGRNGNYTATRNFGPIEFRIVSIPHSNHRAETSD